MKVMLDSQVSNHGHRQKVCHVCKCTLFLLKIFEIPRENKLKLDVHPFER